MKQAKKATHFRQATTGWDFFCLQQSRECLRDWMTVHHQWVFMTQLWRFWFVTGKWADLRGMAACGASLILEILSFRFKFSEMFFVFCATYWKVLKPVVIAFCCWSLLQAICTSSMHIHWISNTDPISFGVSWNRSLVLSADPQAYNIKSNSDSVPTIQIDLASPQSPDSVSAIDEFAHASKEQQQQQEEEDHGLMMKPPAGARRPDKSGDGDVSREQQKLMRCLSDPGPSADEDEDEPFLPWSHRSTDSG